MTDTPSRKALSASELTGADWFKSTYSGGEQACVEVADVRASYNAVAVRDSKVSQGPALLIAPAAFTAFAAAVGEFGDA